MSISNLDVFFNQDIFTAYQNDAEPLRKNAPQPFAVQPPVPGDVNQPPGPPLPRPIKMNDVMEMINVLMRVSAMVGQSQRHTSKLEGVWLLAEQKSLQIQQYNNAMDAAKARFNAEIASAVTEIVSGMVSLGASGMGAWKLGKSHKSGTDADIQEGKLGKARERGGKAIEAVDAKLEAHNVKYQGKSNKEIKQLDAEKENIVIKKEQAQRDMDADVGKRQRKASEFNKKAEHQTQLGGAWSRFGSALSSFVSGIGKVAAATLNFEAAKEQADGEKIRGALEILQTARQQAEEFASQARETFQDVKRILGGIEEGSRGVSSAISRNI